MKKWKKGISALLSIALLCTLLPFGALSALAAEENVIFSYDFENGKVGEGIAQDRTDVNGLYTLTIKPAVAPLTVQNEKGHGNYALIENISDGSSGPKLMKMINLGSVSNLRVSYDY